VMIDAEFDRKNTTVQSKTHPNQIKLTMNKKNKKLNEVCVCVPQVMRTIC
jgi:hypothetical protein